MTGPGVTLGRGRTLGAVVREIDGVSLLSLYLFLLIVVPSQLVVGPLGGAGTPALLVGVGCLTWWSLAHLRKTGPVVARRPIRRAALGFALAIGASHVAASARPSDPAEINTATLGLVMVAGWMGLLLLAHDGVPDRFRLDSYLRRLAWAGTALAGFGLFQFVTHESWVDQLSLPGLTANNALYGAQSREGFTRPAGTAVHPIEFGSVLAMLLPIAVAQAMARTDRGRIRRFLPSAVIFVAIMLSSSRSALVTTAVGMAMLLPVLDRHMRRLAAGAVAVVGAAIFVLVPGMLGTLLGLFTGLSEDNSSVSRVDSYGVAGRYLELSPIFGRGFGTFLPRYRIFDNEYLLLLVETGVVGLLAILALLVVAILIGLRERRRTPRAESGLPVQGLVAAVAAGSVSLALFDAFSFPMVPGLLFLLVGLVGGASTLPWEATQNHLAG